ncbi:MAG: STAS domain-containing protein [Oleibacter sp.]|nr:STAS domain-containing protein [Thalassolituus sp.]
MTSGCIEVANFDGNQIIRLSGDVRLNLCSALDRYITDVLQNAVFAHLYIDLSRAEGVDSTTLGQLAKIAILCRERFHFKPTIYSPGESVGKILHSMGFDQVFTILRRSIKQDASFEEWASASENAACSKEQVIEAHKVLMSLNDHNKETFQELMNTLEGPAPTMR